MEAKIQLFHLINLRQSHPKNNVPFIILMLFLPDNKRKNQLANAEFVQWKAFESRPDITVRAVLINLHYVLDFVTDPITKIRHHKWFSCYKILLQIHDKIDFYVKNHSLQQIKYYFCKKLYLQYFSNFLNIYIMFVANKNFANSKACILLYI